jgi:adenylate cyclase
VAMAAEQEAARWELGDATVLRGRTAATRLAVPEEHARPERDESATSAAR